MSRKKAQKAQGVERTPTLVANVQTTTEARGSRKGPKTQSVRSPRVSKGNLAAHASLNQFSPILGDIDLHLFGEGKHERIYEKLGAHVITHEGKRGVAFAVWAPNADRVSVVGDFNN